MLSAFVICHNEEKTIARCLQSLSFASEIVVVDSGSTDTTLSIVESLRLGGLPIRLETRRWSGFSDQKNFAMSLCQFPWIFTIDADEAATPRLQAKVLAIVNGTEATKATKATGISCYRVRREEFFMGTHLKGGPGAPSYQERLFQNGKVRYIGAIHEYPAVQEGKMGVIHEPILHNPLFTLESALAKMNQYTTLEAHDRFAKGQRTSLLHAFATLFSALYKNFFVYGGYKSGKVGFIWAFLDATSRCFRHIKIWALQNELAQKGQQTLANEPHSSLYKGG